MNIWLLNPENEYIKYFSRDLIINAADDRSIQISSLVTTNDFAILDLLRSLFSALVSFHYFLALVVTRNPSRWISCIFSRLQLSLYSQCSLSYKYDTT